MMIALLFAGIAAADPAVDEIPLPTIEVASELAFGSPRAGVKRARVEVRNVGNGPLEVTQVLLVDHPAFSLAPEQAGFAVMPGKSAYIDVIFEPSDANPQTTTLQIFSTDPEAFVVDVTLTGRGRATRFGEGDIGSEDAKWSMAAVWLGLQAGVAEPAGTYGFGPLVRVEAGAVLPFVGQRLLPFVHVAWTRSQHRGLGTDLRFEDGFTFTTVHTTLPVTAGLAVRALPLSKVFSPEVRVGAVGTVALDRVDAAVDDLELPRATEQSMQLGAMFGVGAVTRIRMDFLTVHLDYHWIPGGTGLSGAPGSMITAGLGFRWSP